jgi:cell shape-determining protein MreC
MLSYFNYKSKVYLNLNSSKRHYSQQIKESPSPKNTNERCKKRHLLCTHLLNVIEQYRDVYCTWDIESF